MQTTDIVVSFGNAISFAHINGRSPTFNNTLSYNQKWQNKPTFIYEQIHFIGDDPKLIQIKAGLTAVVTLTKIDEDGSTSTITPDDTTTYTDFKIYEYLITYSTAEKFCYSVSNGLTGDSLSRWDSECQRVIDPIDHYPLFQWTNSDPGRDTYEFDYNTTLAEENVNYMRVKGEIMPSGFSGETVIYDNQDEQTNVKDTNYEDYTLTANPLPYQIARIIALASGLDAFLVNEEGYVRPDKPELNPFGGAKELVIELTSISVLGRNTDDLGCDNSTTMANEIETIVWENVTGNDSGTVLDGFAVAYALIEVSSGEVTLKIGDTVGGNEVVKEKTGLKSSMGMITVNIVHMPTDGFDGDRPIYLSLSGGTATVRVITIISKQH